jgi:hypothetical protein
MSAIMSAIVRGQLVLGLAATSREVKHNRRQGC